MLQKLHELFSFLSPFCLYFLCLQANQRLLPVAVKIGVDAVYCVCHCTDMTLGAPKELSQLRRFFLHPRLPKHRQYEALRAYVVEGRPAKEVARAFGYSLNSFYVLCHHFRRETHPTFFLSPRHGPQSQPKKSAARDLIIKLRKQNHSVYEISQILKDRHSPLSPTGVREVLKAEGFAPLPRRLDEERPRQPRPTVEPVANVKLFSQAPRTFTTRCGGLFLFVA